MCSKFSALSTRGAVSTCIVMAVLVCVLTIHQVGAQTPAVSTTTTTASRSTSSGSSTGTGGKSQVSDEALEKALSDKRYLMRQLKCALGEVACDPVGKRLKSLAPFVLRGACPQCTPTEATQIKKTLAHLQRNFPAEWNKLVQTYAG